MKPLVRNLIITAAVSVVSVAFFSFVSRRHYANHLGGTLLMIGVFYTAIFMFLAGLACIVRNGGMFKSLSYIKYFNKRARIRRKINNGELTEKDALGSFTDYVLEKYETQWGFWHLFIMSAVLFALYGVLFLLQ